MKELWFIAKYSMVNRNKEHHENDGVYYTKRKKWLMRLGEKVITLI